ncbi:MAG TPA: SIMPL domain-containing protein, partial [Gemmatimonadaceae bacterium]|nr:SIMPL domain-containing protein [Gemmatimonadaceae bacterium]
MRTPVDPIPQIAVSAMHEVKVAPDRATIHISVQTRAPTAAAAASQNATKLQSVLAALRALGLTNDQLSTINYNVHPDYVHREGREPTITGYNVTNTIRADVRQLSQVGRVIDAALSQGANMM